MLALLDCAHLAHLALALLDCAHLVFRLWAALMYSFSDLRFSRIRWLTAAFVCSRPPKFYCTVCLVRARLSSLGSRVDVVY